MTPKVMCSRHRGPAARRRRRRRHTVAVGACGRWDPEHPQRHPELGRGFIPIRKKGKLPSTTIGQDFELEYGVDTIREGEQQQADIEYCFSEYRIIYIHNYL